MFHPSSQKMNSLFTITPGGRFSKIGNVPLRFTKNELIVHNNTWWRLLKIGKVP